MAKTIREAESAIQHGSEALRKAPAEALDAATEMAKEVFESAEEQVGDLSDKVADAIRKQPFQAVGIALGIGCVMGLVIARR